MIHRYNAAFNVENKIVLYLSIFSQDNEAVEYLNEKKHKMLEDLNELKCSYDSYNQNMYIEKMRKIVINIPDVANENITEAISWNNYVLTSVGKEVAEFNHEIETLETKKTKQFDILKQTKDEKIKGNCRKTLLKLNNLIEKLEKQV